MGYWLGTLLFFVIMLITTISINTFGKKANNGLNHLLAFTGVTQCWILWSIVYLAQTNPLVMPELRS